MLGKRGNGKHIRLFGRNTFWKAFKNGKLFLLMRIILGVCLSPFPELVVVFVQDGDVDGAPELTRQNGVRLVQPRDTFVELGLEFAPRIHGLLEVSNTGPGARKLINVLIFLFYFLIPDLYYFTHKYVHVYVYCSSNNN